MKDVARSELIGLFVEVADLALSGRIVDETKNTFLVEVPSGSLKRVPKKGRRFIFRAGSDAVQIDGDDIAFRPEDRTKKARS